jgi:two-component system chemotaxis sensor kinase CheA
MNMTQYLDLFLEESAEHLQSFNQNLLILESNTERLDLLDEIFRSAHTLKGMSATMGYDSIAQLTHQMENLLDKLRERKILLNKDIINCLFKTADALENMVECVRAGETMSVSIDDLKAELKSLENGEYIAAQTKQPIMASYHPESEYEISEFEAHAISEAALKGLNVWKLGVRIDQGCLMKGVRAFMVFRNIETIGDIIKSVPPVQDIEDERFQQDITLYIITEFEKAIIENKIETISEVRIELLEQLEVSSSNQEQNISEIRTEKRAVTNTDTITTADKKQKIHQTVRVDIGRLDILMSLVGELVISKTRLEQIHETSKISGLNETIEQINRITTDLQTVVQNVRMVPIEQVFNRFPRMVRDLAMDLGKSVNLFLEGKETELDRTVIDEIGDPLLHLIRNSIDHGLESAEERRNAGKSSEGMLKLSAKQEGNQVVIEVEDDGRGMDLEQIKRRALEVNLVTPEMLAAMDDASVQELIFEPGFSTAKYVTDVSGRGVGLDVVRSKIHTLSGHVFVETKKGQGTRLFIKLPLTLAIIQALLVRVCGEIFAIPLANIDETTSLEVSQIKYVQEQSVMVLRGKILPLVFLKDILAVPGTDKGEDMYVVVVRKGEQQIGLVAGELIGQQEIVINSLGRLLTGISGIAGASILGDGKVALILDITTLL